MAVQSIRCMSTGDNKLTISWAVYADVQALSINLANNSEFTENMRHFVIPNVTSVSLDIGAGTWYIRIGAWIGEPTHGTIEWSTIHGPVQFNSIRPLLADIPFNSKDLPILHKQSILNGVRIHLGFEIPNYILIAMSEATELPMSATKYRYALSKEYIDWEGLLHPTLYSIRVYRVGLELPSNIIIQLDQGRTFHGLQCSRPLQHSESSSKTASRYESALIRDNDGKTNLRFSSYDDYMRYKIAKAKYADKKYEP